MDVDSVAKELRRLNGDPPCFGPAKLEEKQINLWKEWSARESLIAKWEEQCQKRSEEHHAAKKKKATSSSTSTRRRPSAAYINHPRT